MKALSLHQPWATAIAIGVKSIETRSWTTPYRGLLAIHATCKYTIALAEQTSWYAEELKRIGWDEHARILSGHAGDEWRALQPGNALGKIVCIVRLLDVIPINAAYAIPPEPEAMFGDYSIGRYAWHLRLVLDLPEPYAAVGRRQLWDWEPPPRIQMMGLDSLDAAHDSPRGKSGRSAVGKR